MNVTSIQIRNYLGIEMLQVDKLGKFNRITGGNGVGKTAILKAIREALKSSGNDPHLIRTGADQAEIILQLDKDVRIERKITQKGNNAKVVIGGLAITSPQKYLTDLLGPFIFNPVDFFLAKKPERRKLLLAAIPMTVDKATLKKALGATASHIPLDTLDYSKHALEVLEEVGVLVYGLRHEANLDVTRLTKALEQDRREIPETFDAKAHRGFNLLEKTGELTEAQGVIVAHNIKQRDFRALVSREDELSAQISQVEKNLAALKVQLGDNATEQMDLQNELSGFVAPNIETLQAEIGGYEEAQKLIHKLADIEGREASLIEKTEGHGNLDQAYKQLTTAIPKTLLADAKLPIEGLEIKGDDIFVDGVEIDKRSTSEQMDFSVEMAKTSCGEFKSLCVDHCESLDAEAFAALEKKAPQGGYQLFVTCVTSGKLKISKEQ